MPRMPEREEEHQRTHLCPKSFHSQSLPSLYLTVKSTVTEASKRGGVIGCRPIQSPTGLMTQPPVSSTHHCASARHHSSPSYPVRAHNTLRRRLPSFSRGWFFLPQGLLYSALAYELSQLCPHSSYPGFTSQVRRQPPCLQEPPVPQSYGESARPIPHVCEGAGSLVPSPPAYLTEAVGIWCG